MLSLLYYFNFSFFLMAKGQLIAKADWRAIDSPKKWLDEFVLFAFLLFPANKSNLPANLLFEINWPLIWSTKCKRYKTKYMLIKDLYSSKVLWKSKVQTNPEIWAWSSQILSGQRCLYNRKLSFFVCVNQKRSERIERIVFTEKLY